MTEGERERYWLEVRIQELEAFKKEALECLELALSFAPRGEVPEGLFPTSYHTLNYEDECKLQVKIDAARDFLKQHEVKE